RGDGRRARLRRDSVGAGRERVLVPRLPAGGRGRDRVKAPRGAGNNRPIDPLPASNPLLAMLAARHISFAQSHITSHPLMRPKLCLLTRPPRSPCHIAALPSL